MIALSRAQVRDSALKAGIPVDVVDELLGAGVRLPVPNRHVWLRVVIDDGDTFHAAPPEAVEHQFNDAISGRSCELVIPLGSRYQPSGIRHPGCIALADLSMELDAFYCRSCGMNGRVSGAWCADRIAAVNS